MFTVLEQEEQMRWHVCTRGRGNRMEIQSFMNKSMFKSMPSIGIMSIVQLFGMKGTGIIEVLSFFIFFIFLLLSMFIVLCGEPYSRHVPTIIAIP